MGILRDYLAYAKEHLHPTISEAAHQRLISVYVDMRKIGSGRGQISAYPRQLESLIRLSEAHAKVRLSNRVEVQDVEEAWRLHREALKQSATDPLSGKIDVGILTTGLSEASRKKRADLIATIREQLKKKGGVPTVPYQKLFTDIRESSEIVSRRGIWVERRVGDYPRRIVFVRWDTSALLFTSFSGFKFNIQM